MRLHCQDRNFIPGYRNGRTVYRAKGVWPDHPWTMVLRF